MARAGAAAALTIGTRPPGGVFVIGYTDLPHQVETLSWYPCRLGPGPFYVFHRPYHLGHFEIAASIAEAALDHAPLLQPVRGFCTNVYTYAKKNLREGEVLDGIGGYAAYGMIENREGNLADPGLPICLSENLVLRRDIRKDEKILLRDVDYDPGSPAFTNYHLAQLAGKG